MVKKLNSHSCCDNCSKGNDCVVPKKKPYNSHKHNSCNDCNKCKKCIVPKKKKEKYIGTGHCSCRADKRCSSGCVIAFANIVSPESRNITNNTDGPFVNPRMSNKGIDHVELYEFGENTGYKIFFKEGFFRCGINRRPPIIHVTPCESFVRENILSENSVIWCNSVTHKYAIVATGRWDPEQTSFFPISSPTLDVDFNITAYQALDGDDITIE